MQKIKKIVFPVGGLGTRFLPATKSIPKEMLPVFNKPLIQYAFEEAVHAGIEQFIFITGRNKNAINNHFDYAYELHWRLSEQEKKQEIELTQKWLAEPGRIIFIRQQEPLGLGHAVWCARHIIGNEPFAVSLADELLMSEQGFLKEMIDLYNKLEKKSNIIAVGDIENSLTKNYGIIDPISDNGKVIKIKNMIEKPAPAEAPSNISICGKYILQPEIFNHLAHCPAGRGGEIQLTDAMIKLLQEQDFYGLRFDGERFDCGNPLGYLEANLAYALLDPNFTPQVKNIISKYNK